MHQEPAQNRPRSRFWPEVASLYRRTYGPPLEAALGGLEKVGNVSAGVLDQVLNPGRGDVMQTISAALEQGRQPADVGADALERALGSRMGPGVARQVGGTLGSVVDVLMPGPGEIAAAGRTTLGALMSPGILRKLHRASRLKRPLAPVRVTEEELLRAGAKRPKPYTRLAPTPERRQEVIQLGRTIPGAESFYPLPPGLLARVGGAREQGFTPSAYSVTSWRADPDENALRTSMALDAVRSDPGNPLFPSVTGPQADLMRRIWEDPSTPVPVKTGEYRAAVLGDPRAAVPDVHETRFEGFENANEIEQRLVANRLRSVADQLGILPRDSQQLGWAGIREEAGKSGGDRPLQWWLERGLLDPATDVDRFLQRTMILVDAGLLDPKVAAARIRARAQRPAPVGR